MHRERPMLLTALACAAVLQCAYAPLAAQRSFRIKAVKPLDSGMGVCAGGESAYRVSLRDAIDLEFQVELKPAPDTLLEEEVEIRIDLLDANGQVVEMADSAEVATHDDPPWIKTQESQIGQHLLTLRNRRPKSLVGARFRIRVSVDSTKVHAKDSQVFQLYWIRPQEELCKPLTASPEVPDES